MPEVFFFIFVHGARANGTVDECMHFSSSELLKCWLFFCSDVCFGVQVVLFINPDCSPCRQTEVQEWMEGYVNMLISQKITYLRYMLRL